MRLLAALISTLTLGALGGCCAPAPPPAEKYFDRETPLGAFKGFVYAVDAYQWAYAYASLSESTRKEIGSLKFEVVIRVAKVPVAPDIAVYDLISRSLLEHGSEESDGDREGSRARIRVIPDARDADGSLVLFDAWLYFVKESGEWHFDFFETIQSIKSAPPAGDVSFRGVDGSEPKMRRPQGL